MDDTFMLMDGEIRDPTVPLVDGQTADPTMTDPTLIATKTRRPMVKLTAERLLSDRGLPYVMKNGPKRIHISKKRTPYDNLNNIIQFYQLWAHELYPKAKFKDFTKLCQSVGKTDREVREYRLGLYRDEMLPSMDTQPPPDSIPTSTPTATNTTATTTTTTISDDEDEIYTVRSKVAPSQSLFVTEFEQVQDQDQDELLKEFQKQHQEIEEQRDAIDDDEEDQDALEAMKEMGF